MGLKFIPTYFDEAGNKVHFVPLNQRKGAFPGFTHRVLINQRCVGFLSQDHKPSAKTAEFFLEKYLAKMAA
jgi:hypothetical protein